MLERVQRKNSTGIRCYLRGIQSYSSRNSYIYIVVVSFDVKCVMMLTGLQI